MFKDDDEEEENTFGVTRYPCMPSLVALQQMRNRLHLAFLGRKLMKWTALATGREMRRLAVELYDVYQGFGEDMRNAFILLARSRYFCPQLNHVVTENIGKRAGVIVQQSTRTVSAVKIVQFEIFETDVPPYAHLGLEKGGQCILETKKAWLELLKRLIMMMQLRASFLMVEVANKNATKKMNVLAKIVIPKTNVTMGYINNELEEYAREEFFRLKKVLEIKRKMYGGLEGKKEKKTAEEEEVKGPLCPACLESIEKKEEPYTEPIIEIYKTPSESTSKEDGKPRDEEIDKLLKHLNEIVDVTTDLKGKEILKTSTDDFLKTAKELMTKIEQTNEEEQECIEECQEVEEQVEEHESAQSKLSIKDIDLDKLCDTCKEKYSKTIEKETQTDETEPDSQENESLLNEQEPEEILDSASPLGEESDSEMDTLKTEVKEITKIIKTVNADGSVSIKKTVIKIENEVKTPLRSKASSRISANKSNITGQSSKSSSHSPYSGSKTVGMVTLKPSIAKHNIPLYGSLLRAKSEILKPISSRSGPSERFCMSSMTLHSTDIEIEYEIDNTDCQRNILNTANTTRLPVNESSNVH